MFAGMVVLNQHSPILGRLVTSVMDASSTKNSSLPIVVVLPSYHKENASENCW
jgi:hypothetical protein